MDSDKNTALHINMLGTFHIEYDGKPVDGLDSARLQELLAWLLLHRDSPQPRRQIAFQFWPDSSEKQALTNLRQILYYLKKSLPEAERFLQADQKILQWKPNEDWWLDVKEFEHHLQKACDFDSFDNKDIIESELIKAEKLYKGPLLENCYREWIEPERDRLQKEYISLLEKLIEVLEEKRNYSSAVFYARKLTRSDPYRESTHRTLMRLHALNEDRANVQETWQSCVTLFENDLNLKPSSETQALYKRLISAEPNKSYAVAENKKSSSKMPQDWPLVGRSREWEKLLSCWKNTISGNGNFVSVSGEPGIGKTRLGLELLEYVKKQGYLYAYSRSYETAGNLSYSPVTEWLTEPQIRSTLGNLDTVWLKEVARLLPDLLSKYPNLSEPAPMKENWQRRQFFEALTNVFRNLNRPVLLLLDDLQWCDRETLHWLNYLFHAKDIPNLLVLGTLRPVEGEQNQSLQQLLLDLRRIGLLTEIELYPLNESESYELAGNVSKQQSSIQPQDLYRETEGNPLFVVETIRQGQFTRQKSGYQGLRFMPGGTTEPDLKTPLPPRVNEVISARFEQLTEKTREIMWLAAAIGREFSLQLLYKASATEETVIVNSLEELLKHHIIRESHKNRYDFSHDKLREVAYRKMSSARRSMLHKKIAGALESLHTGNLTSISSRLAFHFDRAHLPKQAIHYYQLASEHAREIYANEVSVALLTRALALVEDLPKSIKRDQIEHDLRAGQCLTFAHIKAYGGKEVIESCNRVYELSKKLNKTPPVSVKRIFAIAKLCNAQLDKAHQIGLELLEQALANDDDIEFVEACYVLGSVLIRQADYAKSREYYEKGLERYNPEDQENHIIRFGQDPSVICLVRLAMIEWLTGDQEKSDHLYKKALERARKIDHPFTLDYVRTHVAWLFNLQGKIDESKNVAEQAFETSSEYGFPYWFSVCEILHGWAIFKNASREKGIESMRKGLREYDSAHIKIDRPYFSSLLARALSNSGKFKEAKKIFEDAVLQMEHTNDRFMEPEVLRFMSEMYQSMNPPETKRAKRSLQKAIKTARTQGARVFEKRAQKILENIA